MPLTIFARDDDDEPDEVDERDVIAVGPHLRIIVDLPDWLDRLVDRLIDFGIGAQKG